MQTRKPVVAGQFYPAEYDSCLEEVIQSLQARAIGPDLISSLPETIAAGIVPHAGWTFSGDLAAMVFSAIKKRHKKVHTFVIFGAAHSYFGQLPAVYDKGVWQTPLGEVFIDEELAQAVLTRGPAVCDPVAHNHEHSIEVQVPFIRHLFDGARILPIIVPPKEQSITLGANIGRIINKQEDKKIICIGSTDLTHYGPGYRFVPMGTGSQALRWAGNVNDRRFIDLALKLEPQRLLTEAAENCNACGPGAAAAAIAAAKQLGKTAGVLLAHTNSSNVMAQRMGMTSLDSVGYAAIVF